MADDLNEIRAVIFDVDGTLVDTVDAHAESWQRQLKKEGVEADFQKVRGQIGKGGDQLMPEFLSPETVDERGEEIDKARSELYKNEYLKNVKPFPKVRELFERIKADGKLIALASSGKDEEIKHYKKLLNIEDLVDDGTTSDDAEESKPEPDIFLAALDKLKKKDASINAAKAVVIGDTHYDVIAAKKANLRTIAVLCGGFEEKLLREAGAIAIYRDPADLLSKYDESPLGQGKRASAAK